MLRPEPNTVTSIADKSPWEQLVLSTLDKQSHAKSMSQRVSYSTLTDLIKVDIVLSMNREAQAGLVLFFFIGMNWVLRKFHCYQINNEGLSSLWEIFTASSCPGDKFIVECCPAVVDQGHSSFSFPVRLQKAVLELSWKVQDRYNLLLGEPALFWDTFFNLRGEQKSFYKWGEGITLLKMTMIQVQK